MLGAERTLMTQGVDVSMDAPCVAKRHLLSFVQLLSGGMTRLELDICVAIFLGYLAGSG